MDLLLKARLRLLGPGDGGRRTPMRPDYRCPWNLHGRDDGAVVLHDALLRVDGFAWVDPGDEAEIAIRPVSPERWAHIDVGSVIDMHDGNRVVGHATILRVVIAPDPDQAY